MTQTAQGAPLEKVNPNTWRLGKPASPPKPFPNLGKGSGGLFQGPSAHPYFTLVCGILLIATAAVLKEENQPAPS